MPAIRTNASRKSSTIALTVDKQLALAIAKHARMEGKFNSWVQVHRLGMQEGCAPGLWVDKEAEKSEADLNYEEQLALNPEKAGDGFMMEEIESFCKQTPDIITVRIRWAGNFVRYKRQDICISMLDDVDTSVHIMLWIMLREKGLRLGEQCRFDSRPSLDNYVESKDATGGNEAKQLDESFVNALKRPASSPLSDISD